MIKISCIILNYNDSQNTIAQIQRISGYQCFDTIIVVDNCSTDDSMLLLEPYASETLVIVKAEKNAGYGAGNNVGIHYAYEVLEADYAVIANPDTEFTQECVAELAGLFMHHEEVGIVAATMNDSSDGSQASGWPLLSWNMDLLNTGPLCRRIFRKFLSYPEEYFSGKRAVYVDVVHGSMLMVDLEKMISCGGYDEGIFLYGEENILGYRMKDMGWHTVQLLSQTYIHENSGTISKTYESVIRRQELRHQSAVYYYQHYLHINVVQMAVTRCFHKFILFEIWFCKQVLGIRW